MIVNAFSWMNAVVRSFSCIGAAVTGLPALSPQTVLEIGSNMASTIFNAPATISMVTNLELVIVQSVSAFGPLRSEKSVSGYVAVAGMIGPTQPV